MRAHAPPAQPEAMSNTQQQNLNAAVAALKFGLLRKTLAGQERWIITALDLLDDIQREEPSRKPPRCRSRQS